MDMGGSPCQIGCWDDDQAADSMSVMAQLRFPRMASATSLSCPRLGTLPLAGLALVLGMGAACGGGDEGPQDDGRVVEYYDDAQLIKKAEGVRKYGREEGLWLWYHPNGAKQREQAFQQGLREGPMTVWGADGALAVRGQFAGDLENGVFEEFWPNGAVRSRTQYQSGTIVGKVERYYPDGAIQAVTVFEGGSPSGEEILYHADGSVYWKKTFTNGVAEGPTHARHPGGGLAFSGQFRGGKTVGTWHHWHADGSYKGAQVFDAEGQASGTWIEYSPAGDAILSRSHLEGGDILSQEWTADGARRSYGRIVVRPGDGAWLSDGPFFVWGPDGALDPQLSGRFADFERAGDLNEEDLQRAELLQSEPAQPEARGSGAPKRESFDPGT